MLLFVPFRQRSLFSSSSRRKSKTLTPSTTAPTTTMAGKQKNWLTWKGRYLADSAYTTLYDVAVRILTRRANARRSWRKSQKTMPRLSSVNTSAKMTWTRDDRRWASSHRGTNANSLSVRSWSTITTGPWIRCSCILQGASSDVSTRIVRTSCSHGTLEAGDAEQPSFLAGSFKTTNRLRLNFDEWWQRNLNKMLLNFEL